MCCSKWCKQSHKSFELLIKHLFRRALNCVRNGSFWEKYNSIFHKCLYLQFVGLLKTSFSSYLLLTLFFFCWHILFLPIEFCCGIKTCRNRSNFHRKTIFMLILNQPKFVVFFSSIYKLLIE